MEQRAGHRAVFVGPGIDVLHIPGSAQALGECLPARTIAVALVPERYQLFLKGPVDHQRQGVDQVGDFDNTHGQMKRGIGYRLQGQEVIALDAQRRHFEDGLPGQDAAQGFIMCWPWHDLVIDELPGGSAHQCHARVDVQVGVFLQ